MGCTRHRVLRYFVAVLLTPEIFFEHRSVMAWHGLMITSLSVVGRCYTLGDLAAADLLKLQKASEPSHICTKEATGATSTWLRAIARLLEVWMRMAAAWDSRDVAT